MFMCRGLLGLITSFWLLWTIGKLNHEDCFEVPIRQFIDKDVPEAMRKIINFARFKFRKGKGSTNHILETIESTNRDFPCRLSTIVSETDELNITRKDDEFTLS